jgi:serine protease Do
MPAARVSLFGLTGDKGALVADTQANSPAAAAGIRSGDVITAVNGDKVDGPRELARKIAGIGSEKSAKLTYVHDGSEKTANVTLGVLPNDQRTASDMSSKANPSSLKSFGLTLAPATGGQSGVMVAEVEPDGAAAQKGIKEGDMIVEVAGHAVSRPSDVRSAIDAARKDGRKAVLMRVKSGEGTRFVALGLNPAG